MGNPLLKLFARRGKKEEAVQDDTSLWNLTRFFFPLFIQSLSQAFTYPLVASVVSHGALGVSEYDAYVIGQQVVTIIVSIGFGIVTTGLVFATSRIGYTNFKRMQYSIAAVALSVQALAGLPWSETVIFRNMLGLESSEMITVARYSVLASIPLQFNFYVRNPYMVMLLLAKRSDLSNIATLIRIVIAVALSYLFVHLGLVGCLWGVVAMTLPCILETALTWLFAIPYLKKLPELDPYAPADTSPKRQLKFTLPLSVGSILTTFTGTITTYFLSRTADPLVFRPVHFVAYGLALPVFAACNHFQTIIATFMRTSEKNSHKILRFLFIACGIMTILPIMLAYIPIFSKWYYCSFQNLPESSRQMAAHATSLGAAFTIFFALTAAARGLASIRLRSSAIFVGQITYLVFYILAFVACEKLLPIPGYLWGMIAIGSSTLFCGLATYLSIGKPPKKLYPPLKSTTKESV